MSAVCRRQDAIVLRPMQVQDFPAVLQVQQHCYPPSLIESRDALASRHRLSPDTCWVAERPGQLLGYVFAHPWTAGRPPSLNRPLERLPDAVDTLFIHDLALHPDARGHGQGPRLVAVQGAARYWKRFGYQPCARDDYTRRAHGEDAVGMRRSL